MIACYPHDDDATLYLFHTLAQKYGCGLHRQIRGEPAQLGAGAPRRLALGRRRHGPRHARCDDLDRPQSEEGRAADRVRVLATSTRSPIYYSTAGIFKDAPHPNVAKLYLTWVLAAASSRAASARSRRARDVPPPGGAQAAVLLQRGERLPGLRDQRAPAHRSAQALRGRDRPDPQCRRSALTLASGAVVAGGRVLDFAAPGVL